MIHIKTLSGGVDFDITISTGIITKIEKWNSVKTTVKTHVTGGEGKITTGWDGKVRGKIAPTNTTITQETNSHVNTRIFYGNKAFITIENCDFISQEGDELKVLFFVYNKKIYPVQVVDKNTGFYTRIWNFKRFSNQILPLVRPPNIKSNLKTLAIGIVLLMALNKIFTGWLVLLLFPIDLFSAIFLLYIIWQLIKDIYCYQFNKHLIIDEKAEYKTREEIQIKFQEFDKA